MKSKKKKQKKTKKLQNKAQKKKKRVSNYNSPGLGVCVAPSPKSNCSTPPISVHTNKMYIISHMCVCNSKKIFKITHQNAQNASHVDVAVRPHGGPRAHAHETHSHGSGYGCECGRGGVGNLLLLIDECSHWAPLPRLVLRLRDELCCRCHFCI